MRARALYGSDDLTVVGELPWGQFPALGNGVNRRAPSGSLGFSAFGPGDLGPPVWQRLRKGLQAQSCISLQRNAMRLARIKRVHVEGHEPGSGKERIRSGGEVL